MKEFPLCEEMKKFFDNLLEIKEFVKKEAESSKDPILYQIYNMLDRVIKTEGTDE